MTFFQFMMYYWEVIKSNYLFQVIIAVSSFGESLRRVTLTAPAEAIFNRQKHPPFRWT
jgi:hypothetical protein